MYYSVHVFRVTILAGFFTVLPKYVAARYDLDRRVAHQCCRYQVDMLDRGQVPVGILGMIIIELGLSHHEDAVGLRHSVRS